MTNEFISSIGLKSGERNINQQISTNDAWKDVDWFLHTWGFLPNDTAPINKLSERNKNRIILLLLDFAWRKNNEEYFRVIIQIIQSIFDEEKLTDYFK